MNPSNHGYSHISLNNLSNEPTHELEIYTPLTDKESKLAAFMHTWLTINPKARQLLSHVFAGTSQSTIARLYHVSRSNICQRLCILARQYPEINAILKPRMRALRNKGKMGK